MSADAIDAACALFDIKLHPDWRDAAITNFAAITAAAQLVLTFPLDDEAEYAPIFQP